MNSFYIKIIDKKIKKINKIPSCVGQICIGSFKENFVMPLEFWTLDNYLYQWKEGLERLSTHNSSCLVTAVQDPSKNPLLDLWVLYKDNNTVFIQNHMFFDESFMKFYTEPPFTAQTCYKFIRSRTTQSKDGRKISEWQIPLRDLLLSQSHLGHTLNRTK